MRARLLALALAVPACTDTLTLDEMACPPEGTTLTYATFGAAFLDDHCNGCHTDSSSGAPRAFRFDTHDEVRTHAARIFERAAGPNVTMPPGPDDPPAEQRDQLAEWLACGAP